MPTGPKPPPVWPDLVLVCLFALFIALPTVDTFTGIDHARPPDENRLPHPAPRWSGGGIAGIKQYMADAEGYFNDHFGFRKRLIRWSLHWKSRLFHDENGHKVVVGQDGWLYTGELEMVDHYLGLRHLTPQELAGWKQLLERRQAWLARQGIKYLFVVAPDKQDIYPEHLPTWLLAATPAQRETKLDQFLAYLRTNSTVPVVDLRPNLLAHKSVAPLYLVNDIHWNQIGGLYGGQTVLEEIRRQLPALPPFSLADYTWTNTPVWGGDMATYLQTNPREINHFEVLWQPPTPPLQIQDLAPVDTVWDRNAPRRLVVNPAAPDVRAFFFHDSFALPWRDTFGHYFRQVFFLQERREFDGPTILKYHPHIVVNEMLERYFNCFDPADLMAKDNLSPTE